MKAHWIGAGVCALCLKEIEFKAIPQKTNSEIFCHSFITLIFFVVGTLCDCLTYLTCIYEFVRRSWIVLLNIVF